MPWCVADYFWPRPVTQGSGTFPSRLSERTCQNSPAQTPTTQMLKKRHLSIRPDPRKVRGDPPDEISCFRQPLQGCAAATRSVSPSPTFG